MISRALPIEEVVIAKITTSTKTKTNQRNLPIKVNRNFKKNDILLAEKFRHDEKSGEREFF